MPIPISSVSIVPASPYENQDFYVVFGFGATYSTVTGAFCSIGSYIAPIKASGASYAAIFPGGSVPAGSYAIYGFAVSGSVGRFTNSRSITIQASEIADITVTVYNLIRNNIAATYSSTLVSTGWYSTSHVLPQITVTRAGGAHKSKNLSDTYKEHDEDIHIDSWVGSRAFGAGLKRAKYLLDAEVKRIINANRKDPSTKVRHLELYKSDPMDEVERTDNRRIFRTRHTVIAHWVETVS